MSDFLNLTQIAAVLGLNYSSKLKCSSVSIDTRTLQEGALFIALKGENYDGHTFAKEAVSKGAVALITNKLLPDIKVPQLVVQDSLLALVALAKYYRSLCKAKIIALTGSNGKTTVKSMIAKMLPKPSHATPGNLNNHIGVPLSILQLKFEDKYAVFELGANHLGEVATNVALVKPQVALINNVAPAHIGEFGSLDNIARAKGEIYQGLDPTGIAIINDDNDYSHFWDESLLGKKVFRYSLKQKADFFVTNLRYNELECARFSLHAPDKTVELKLQVPGEHNVANALAAIAACYALNIPWANIIAGLESFTGVNGRMAYLKGLKGAVIIDDSYNANLASTLAALEILKNYKGKKVLVFGDMGELGEYSYEHHKAVGLKAALYNIDLLFAYGEKTIDTAKAYGQKARHFDTHEELNKELLKSIDANTVVLVKGSRSSHMEKVVQALAAG